KGHRHHEARGGAGGRCRRSRQSTAGRGSLASRTLCHKAGHGSREEALRGPRLARIELGHRMVDTERIVGATVAGTYRIRRIIGRGSMGVVCEAEHLEIGKRVAIKLIETTLIGMKDVAARFRREARATSLVENQHIVHVFDVGSDETLGLYLVMEYLTGEDLAQVLAREKRLAPARAVQIALQVARGLAKAHAAGVVHRDLKPANIFLCS